MVRVVSARASEETSEIARRARRHPAMFGDEPRAVGVPNHEGDFIVAKVHGDSIGSRRSRLRGQSPAATLPKSRSLQRRVLRYGSFDSVTALAHDVLGL